MAFLEDLQRTAGEPRRPEMPGAAPTPSRSPTFVKPPAAASGPQGRPPRPAPSFPGGTGRDLPVTPGTAQPAAPSSPGSTAGAKPPMPGGTQASTGPQSMPQNPPAPTIGADGQPQAAMTFSMDHVPSKAELLRMPPGASIQTPYGVVGQDGRLQLSPEGQVKYQEAVVQRRKQFGAHPFAADPNAPPPPVDLGKRSFNPFSRKWLD